MSKQKVLFLKGLPASGKSTFSKEIVAKDPTKWMRVNKDSLRLMLHDGEWSKAREKIVMDVHFIVANRGLEQGMNVIIDDTNFSPKHETRFRALAEQYDADFEVKFFDTPVEDCIKRDRNRKDSVGKHVIMEMYDKYLKPAPMPSPEHNPDLKDAVIFDCDGTLCKMHNRGAYEWSKVGEDLPNNDIIELCRMYKENGYQIIIVTGRDGSCGDETKKWLEKYNVPFDHFFIRETGNMEKDSVIKKRIYDNNIRGKFNIIVIVDDRNSVVSMWRSLGLRCFQVDFGDF